MTGTASRTSPAIRLVRNVMWNFGGQAWSLCLAFFTVPYIVHRLGTDAYGLLMTAGLVTSYLWFMDLGLGSATTKYVAEHATREEWDEVNRILWTSLAVYLVLGSIAALTLVLITPLCVYRWLRIPSELQGAAVSVFHLSAIGFLVGMVNNVPASVPQALQRFDIVNRVGVAVGTAQTLLTVVLLAFGYSVREVVIGNVIVAGLSLGMNTLVARVLLPRWSPPIWSFASFRRLARFGSFVAVSRIVGPILVQFEKLVLANQISMSALTYYTAPSNLVTRLSVFSGAFSSALFPLFSSLHGTGRENTSTDINMRASRYVMLLLIVPVVFFIVFGREFLQFWIGPEFARESTAALQILAVATLVNAAAWSPSALLQASGRPDLTARFHVAELVIHVPLTFACVRFWGVTGAAWAWFFRVILDTTLIYWAMIRLYVPDWGRYMRELLSPALGVTVATGIVLAILRTALHDQLSPAGVLIGLGGTFLAVACVSIWRWGFRQEEYQILVRALLKRREA
ncbi:MAG TPA: flippase [bacterium]|nr:flippase [bacterium]